MSMEVLFAGVGVGDFDAAVEWYARLFGRAADVIAHDREVMWRVADGGWLYVLQDPDRAGQAQVAIAVSDLGATMRDLATRGIEAGSIETVSDTARKAKLTDPDGNLVALIEVTGPSETEE